MNWMADEIEAGNVNPFDITYAGKFLAPRTYQKAQVIDEYYARPLSGAAINAKEWAKFKAEVLTMEYMATREGRVAAAERLRELVRNHIMAGALLTKDDNWITKLRRFEEVDTSRKPSADKPPAESSDFDALWGE